MSTIELKSNIHQLLERVHDDVFLAKVERILENHVADEPVIWNNLSEELKKQLESAEEDSKAGRTTPHEEIVKKFRQKYSHFYES